MRRSSRVFHVEHLQCMVFGLTHGGGVFWRFVFEPGQMKHPMRHHAPEFILKHNALIFSVFRHAFKGNQEVTRQGGAFGVVECDDVGVRVVVEVLTVVGEQLFV